MVSKSSLCFYAGALHQDSTTVIGLLGDGIASNSLHTFCQLEVTELVRGLVWALETAELGCLCSQCQQQHRQADGNDCGDDPSRRCRISIRVRMPMTSLSSSSCCCPSASLESCEWNRQRDCGRGDKEPGSRARRNSPRQKCLWG